MDNAEWKIYQFNEYDTVAGPDFQTALDWYTKEMNITEAQALDGRDMYERSVLDTIWTPEEDVLTPDEMKLPLKRQLIGEVTCVLVTFEKILSVSNAPHPFIIASVDL